jgi:hypothetical protein
LYKIPEDLLKNFLDEHCDDSTRVKLLTQTAMIKDGKLTSTIKVNDGDINLAPGR